MLSGAKSPIGELYITTVPPIASEPRNGGIAFSNTGQVHVSTALAPQLDVNGFAVRSDGTLCIAYGGAIASWQQGLPFTSDGRLVTQLNTVPAASDPYVGGIRVGPLGGVYVTDAAVPLPFSFSNGFDRGYDAP